jgi:hypothetical protein
LERNALYREAYGIAATGVPRRSIAPGATLKAKSHGRDGPARARGHDAVLEGDARRAAAPSQRA